jgi:tetratricopeptide (TPR) repeat protein
VDPKAEDKQHLDEAVEQARSELTKVEDGSSEQLALSLWALSETLEDRYDALDDVRDLRERAALRKRAISLLHDADERHSPWTYRLGWTYYALSFESEGPEARDLAIQHFLRALELLPPDDTRVPYALILCSELLDRRYWKSRSFEDAEKAVRLSRQARSLMDTDHVWSRLADSTLCSALSGLGMAHVDVFHTREDKSMADLEDSIAAYRERLRMCPPDTDRYPEALNELGTALGILFKNCGDRAAGHEAFSLHQAAVAASPPGHPGRYNSLQALGLAVEYLSTEETHERDLALRTSIFEEALTLTPLGHEGRIDSLQFVASVHRSQFYITRNEEQINRAAEMYEESIQICPREHEQRHQCLSMYAALLIVRYEEYASAADLDRAEECCQEVLGLIRPNHPAKFLAFNNLLCIYLLRDAPDSMDHAIKWMFCLLENRYGNVRDRLDAVLRSLHYMRNQILSVNGSHEQRDRLLEIHRQALQLISQVAHTALDVETRLQNLMETERLAIDAATVALACSRPEAAIECLEDGRAMFWAQGLVLRASFEELPSEMATELRDISQFLETGSYSPQGNALAGTPEDLAGMMRRKTTRYRVLLEEARKLPGMGRFLLNVGYPVLSTASKNGFIVVLLGDQMQCHAIAIAPDGVARHIPLPGLDPAEVDHLGVFIKEESMRYRSEMQESDDGGNEIDRLRLKMKKPHSTAEISLAKLWHKVIKPIVSALNLKARFMLT